MKKTCPNLVAILNWYTFNATSPLQLRPFSLNPRFICVAENNLTTRKEYIEEYIFINKWSLSYILMEYISYKLDIMEYFNNIRI